MVEAEVIHTLADMVGSAVEGGIVMSPRIERLPQQLTSRINFAAACSVMPDFDFSSAMLTWIRIC